MVLGRRADHGRAADVDVLDCLRVGRVAARDRLLEGVEVHADQVDLLDPVLRGCGQMGVLVATGQQTCVQPRVKRLHAPIHHLGKAGEVLYRPHGDAGYGELPGGPAGRDDLHAELDKALGQLDHAGLV